MGARQSKRSVDITTTPKKEGIPSEGAVGDAATPGDGKLERIEESDAKPTTNGIAYRTDVNEDKDKDKDDSSEKEKEKQPSEESKSEETKQESSGESPAEGAEVTTPTEGNTASPNTVASPENKEPKKKDKMRKKWSLRSISFSKKDKSKPAREEAPKNGDVTKEEPLPEGGEECDQTVGVSPVEEGESVVSSPSENNSSTPLSPAVEVNEESSATMTTTTTTTAAAVAAPVATTPETATEASTVAATTTPPATSPVAEDKKEEPAPSDPTPVPLEDKKGDVEKVEGEKKADEVSPADDGGRSLTGSIKVSIFQVQPVDTPSIIERKTSEDLPSQLPLSPPPTPIEPSPLQQAQQAAATAVTVTALAKALELPVEPVIDKDVATTEVNPTLPPILHQDPLEDAPEFSLLVRDSNNDPLKQSSPILSNLESTTVIENIIIPANVDSTLLITKDGPVGIVNKTDDKTISILTEPDKTNFNSKLETGKTDTDILEHAVTIVEDIPKSPKCNVSDNIAEDIQMTEELQTDETKMEEIQDNVDIVIEPKQESNDQIDTRIKDDKKILSETPSCKVENNEVIILEELNSSPSKVVLNPDKTYLEQIVEAKPAVVIPCEETEAEDDEIQIIEIVAPKVDSKNLVEEIISEEKIKKEPISSDTTLPVEDVLVEEVIKLENSSSAKDLVMETDDQPVTETIAIIENLADMKKDIIQIAEIDSSVTLPMSEPRDSFEEFIPEQSQPHPPPPLPPSSSSSTTSTAIAEVSDEQLSNVEETKESLEELTSNVNELSLSSQEDTIVTTNVPTERQSPSLTTVTEITTCLLPIPSTPPPPPPPPYFPTKEEEDYSCPSTTYSSVFPMPPSHEPATLSPPSSPQYNISNAYNNVTDFPILMKPLTPSTIIQSSIVSSTTTATTNDCSQTQLHDDQTDDLKTESVSQSLNSYNDSEVELKERLTQSLAETENQKDTLSCRSLNDDVSTVFQENHQSTPEIENPVVEKTVTHEVGTTENNVEEAPKVAPPAIPIEVPASPPSAPAITEDVASVTKAIEEIDISEKAVAAAVNESIECNTNEIIADAHHQNNMNE